MTADEVEEYITQIAFSGATQFLEKYKDKTTEDEMIGHFGLGFYSAFMVADEVQIDTLSYKEGAKPVHWASRAEQSMRWRKATTVGSENHTVLNEDSLEFANEYRERSSGEILFIYAGRNLPFQGKCRAGIRDNR